MSSTFATECEILDKRTHRYLITRNGERLSYAEVLRLWQDDEEFRALFVQILSDAPFEAHRWETPPITVETVPRPFEFVLLNSPGLARTVDPDPFREHFLFDDSEGVVAFENLRKDALLVVPSPRGSEDAYGHLAAFVRRAPEAQVHELWRVVGESMEQKLSDDPVWLSTAGAGVAWLHVRLDSRPKYYWHAPYRNLK